MSLPLNSSGKVKITSHERFAPLVVQNTKPAGTFIVELKLSGGSMAAQIMSNLGQKEQGSYSLAVGDSLTIAAQSLHARFEAASKGKTDATIEYTVIGYSG